jgi:hypothetical protein
MKNLTNITRNDVIETALKSEVKLMQMRGKSSEEIALYIDKKTNLLYGIKASVDVGVTGLGIGPYEHYSRNKRNAQNKK